jgi:nonspecific dipeptidase
MLPFSSPTGKFSVRIVPDQTPEYVEQKVLAHLAKKWSERGSPNRFSASLYTGFPSWVGDPDAPGYLAGRRATKMVYGVDADLTREGCSIPVILTLQATTGKHVVLLPVGACDDGAHSQNEKVDERNYVEGTKLLGAFMHELARL